MPQGDAYGGPPPHRNWQRVLNQSWPLRDDKGQPHARGIKDVDHPIPVTVRIIWEHDGEEHLDGIATRWHGRSVHVAISDWRAQVQGVWVDAADVRRRWPPL